MTVYHTTFPTSFGNFSAAVDETGALLATAFGGLRSLQSRAGRTLAGADWIHDDARTGPVREQVLAYARGEQRDFRLRLAPLGTRFQRRVWGELKRIPWGQTLSYADIARRLRTAPRAVGAANARNPICLVVPCHRVNGSDGSLTGFAFGVSLKRRLQAHEQPVASTRDLRAIRTGALHA